MSDGTSDDPKIPDTKSDTTPSAADGLKPVVTGHIPAAATLYGPHPDEGAVEDATGSPGADREREQAEKP